MNQFHNIQIRFPADSITTGAEISFKGSAYKLGEPMPKTLQPSHLPMGVTMNGYTEQFQLLQNGQRIGAAWFYFYGAFEGNRWAVLDVVALDISVPT